MFKAFYWMFERKDVRNKFFKRNIYILIIAAIIALIFSLSCHLIFTNTYIFYGYLGLFVTFCFTLLLSYFVLGSFWELTASVIERKTDIISSDIYGGKVSLAEFITLPEINILKFIWRGFSSSIAMIIMEIPVVILFFSTIFLRRSECIYVVYAVQFLIWFLSLGLFWNYANNNSIFSMLNIYVAGYLLENHPFKYIWNSILNIVNYALFYAVGIAIIVIFNISLKQDFNTYYDCIKFAGFEIVALVMWIYILHVQAYLVGTLSPNNDYL